MAKATFNNRIMKEPARTHYLWYKLGINKELWNLTVRPAVLKRDGFKCTKCGSTEWLDIHHKDYNDFTIHSLVTLCKKCHSGENYGIKSI